MATATMSTTRRILKVSENLIYLPMRTYMPCKTTSNKAATWTNSKLPKVEKAITDNVKLVTAQSQSSNTPSSSKPMVIVLEWLMAKKKHTSKFADLYLDRGFDVLSVRLRPWQLIWPVKGSQPLASNILHILQTQYSHRPLLIHGFSVGGYLWGEIQLKMAQDLAKYQQLINNISGAIWDSVVDINETVEGVPMALFPRNNILQNACKKYILYHMKRFDKEATQHWRRSREVFYSPVVTCPALLLFSNTDPIGNTASYANVRASYENMGIQTFEKCWEKSPHVAHFAYHREEYIAQLDMFLERIGLVPSSLRTQPLRATAVTAN